MTDRGGAVRYWPVEIRRRAYLKHGPVHLTRLGRTRYAYLLGPEANRLVFSHDEWFSMHEAMKGLIPVDGPSSVVVSDGADHARRRAAIRPALAPRSIEGYLSAMADSAREAVRGIPPGQPVDGYPVFRKAIRRSTLRSLFGKSMAADADHLGEMLQPLLTLVDRLPQSIDVHRRLRTPIWRCAMTARESLDTYIAARIVEVRSELSGTGANILRLLVNGPDGVGSGLDDGEVRDQAVTLIAAGYETTSAAMGWIIHALARHPEWQERAKAEAARVMAQQAPSPATLRELTILPAIVTEALRLYPPAAISARHVEQPFSFAGKEIRAGDLLVYSPYVTHRDPGLYHDPESFDPRRWIDAARPAPEHWLPFGGGGHRCIGSHLATTELTIMTAALVDHGRFAPVGPPPRAKSFAAMRPTHARIRF